MRHHRRWVVTTVLTMLLFTGCWFALSGNRPDCAAGRTCAPEWHLQTWYQLDGVGSKATCKLSAGNHYRLVLGCLSDAAYEHLVKFHLEFTQFRSDDDERASSAITLLGKIDHKCRNPLLPSDDSSMLRAENPQSQVGLRDFFLHVTDGSLNDPKQYARITAFNAASGTRVRVFVDQQLARGEVPQTRIDEIIRLLDQDIVPRVESQYGPLKDVDGDGSLAVVLTPWLNRLQGGRTSIGGMVRSDDFRRDLSSPFSNHGDTLFINSALPGNSALRDLLSHEVAHAACISQRLSHKTGILRDEEDWLSEALAHLAEPGLSNLDHRLAAFLEDPSQYPLVVPDYYRAGMWRNPGCRGATYLFTRWCVELGGVDLARGLARSTATGTRNLEQTMKQPFENLFRNWSLSVASGAQLDSLGIQNALSRIGSSGLKPIAVNSNSGVQALTIRGTAFAIVDLSIDESFPFRLHIAGDETSKWQFSICRCSKDSSIKAESHSLAAMNR